MRRRALLALPLLALLALPALGTAQDLCTAEKDPANLPVPEALVAQAQAYGFDLAVAKAAPLPLPLTVGEAQDNHPCHGKLRPGVQLVINGAWLCTANWIYEDDLDNYYLGTAGHCAVPGDNVVAAGVGRVGDVAFSTGNGGVGNDFALIRIDPAHYAKIVPTMCHWGGPLDVATRAHFSLLQAQGTVHYGWGFLYGNTVATRPRAGIIEGPFFGSNSFLWETASAPGDSGSGVQTASGAVLGVLTHGIQAPGVPLGAGIAFGTSVQHGLDLARAATGRTYQVTLTNVAIDPTGLSVP